MQDTYEFNYTRAEQYYYDAIWQLKFANKEREQSL